MYYIKSKIKMRFSNKLAKFDSRRVSEHWRSFGAKHERLPYPGEWDILLGIIKVYHNERLALWDRRSRGNELFCTSRANSPQPTFRKTSPRVACDAHAQFTCTGGGLMSVEDTRGGLFISSGQRREENRELRLRGSFGSG